MVTLSLGFAAAAAKSLHFNIVLKGPGSLSSRLEN